MVEKVVSLHLMRQLWLFLGRLTFSSFLLCEAHSTTHVYLGWFFTVEGAHIGPVFVCPRRHSSSNVFLNKLGSTGLGWKSFGPPFPFWSWLGSVRGPRPIVDFENFTPTIIKANTFIS